MARSIDKTTAAKQKVRDVSFVPVTLDESQDQKERIMEFIEQNRSNIGEVALLTKVDPADAVQETYLFLNEHPQYVHHVQSLGQELPSRLKKYARPKHDALTRAKRMTVIPSNQEDELDEALIKSADMKIRRWREEYEPTDEQLDYLATAASKRPSGKKTALRVLKCIFSNAGYTCKEIASDLSICPRRVQQIVADAERFLWQISDHTSALTT